MEGSKRREKLLEILQMSEEAISGSKLSKQLGVSRQVVVQDIALLRAKDIDIIPTTKGYVINKPVVQNVTRHFWVRHKTSQIEDELCSIVDHGGKVIDVSVKHPFYGNIRTDLVIENRADVTNFVQQVKAKEIVPLKELTNGEHCHTVEAKTEAILDQIEEVLRNKKYLIHI